jgi:hypothetical protein
MDRDDRRRWRRSDTELGRGEKQAREGKTKAAEELGTPYQPVEEEVGEEISMPPPVEILLELLINQLVGEPPLSSLSSPILRTSPSPSKVN